MGSMLPLKSGSNIAVVGPMGMTTNLMSDYAGGTGEAGCWPNSDSSCVKTIAQAIADANNGGSTTMAKGVDVNSKSTGGIAEALNLVKAADIAVLVLGNDRTQEHEGIDRPDINLPGMQEPFAKQVLALGKPTLLILSNGGAVAIDNLIKPSQAIIESFNPAQMTPALAALIFGRENRWGKLPVTIYPHAYTSEQSMTNYDMSKAPGRTYKYYKSSTGPLFEFGHGLSLTTFDITCSAKDLSFSCDVKNTGKLAGDEVLMVYHAAGDAIRSQVDHPVPIKSLVNFERVQANAGETVTASFKLDNEDLMLVNKKGEKVLYKGERTIIIKNGAGFEYKAPVTIGEASEVLI